MPLDLPVILVLASGRGERYRAAGGTTHKLTAELGGMTVLERVLSTVKASGLPWHLEQADHAGMGDSIAAAIKATQDAQGWLILPADLPLVRPATLQQVLEQLRRFGDHVIIPYYQGRRGHPVAFPRSCHQDLSCLTGDRGAWSIVQQMLQKHLVHHLPVDDIGTVTDIDTPADLAQAAAIVAARRD